MAPRKKYRSNSTATTTTSDNNSNATIHMLINQMIRKDSEYRTGINENQTYCNIIANRVIKDGEFERILSKKNSSSTNTNFSNDDNDELQFLQEQRNRLKELAQLNMDRTMQANSFVQALQRIQQQQQDKNNNNNQEEDDEEEEEENITNYETTLDEMMNNLLPGMICETNYYKEICEKLGEPIIEQSSSQSNGTKKKKRKSQPDDDDDDDDDLQITTIPNNINLKCPLAGGYLEHPMKSKVCGHIYSKHAIIQHLKRDKRCPIPGCNNISMTIIELEDDIEIAHLVKRTKKSIEKQQLKQKQQQELLSDDDDDDEEEQEEEDSSNQTDVKKEKN